MRDFSRYGVVEVDGKGRVESFREKTAYREGLINGGVYLLEKESFLSRNLPAKFSFEGDYLERFYGEGRFFATPQDTYFIDIGIPEDFAKAQIDLERQPLSLQNIDPSWTLFLDRDGVINEELHMTYVLDWSQFKFSAGVLPAMERLAKRFGKIVVVSNQRGIGKGLMTPNDIATIHENMVREVKAAGGRIDAIYYSTDTNDDSFHRKPNPGMALQAREEFPSINLRQSVMVGNKLSDMQFGRAAGMYTVFVTSTDKAPGPPYPRPDLEVPSLSAFASALQP
jgi:D-glycero-alpha-D-manno-heptose 1-phosphate guanylyltransferase